MNAKYVHTNIVARDWRKLANFYVDVFGCTPLLPERNYSGSWLNELTGLQGEVRIRGVHLQLPGYDSDGPTLEIFEYEPQPARPDTGVNQPGFAHIAFHVDNVEEARTQVRHHGGSDLGTIQTRQVPGAGHVILIYMTDPEGNIIELQNWS